MQGGILHPENHVVLPKLPWNHQKSPNDSFEKATLWDFQKIPDFWKLEQQWPVFLLIKDFFPKFFGYIFKTNGTFAQENLVLITNI